MSDRVIHVDPTAFPRSVTDALCLEDHPIVESIDRRMLWHLEGFLSVHGTTDTQRAKGRAIRDHLNRTCTHHWHDHEGDEDIPAHRQCLWCCDVEWSTS